MASAASSAAVTAVAGSPAAVAVSERPSRLHASPSACPLTRAISTAASCNSAADGRCPRTARTSPVQNRTGSALSRPVAIASAERALAVRARDLQPVEPALGRRQSVRRVVEAVGEVIVGERVDASGRFVGHPHPRFDRAVGSARQREHARDRGGHGRVVEPPRFVERCSPH